MDEMELLIIVHGRCNPALPKPSSHPGFTWGQQVRDLIFVPGNSTRFHQAYEAFKMLHCNKILVIP
jgi:hypothetical protein